MKAANVMRMVMAGMLATLVVACASIGNPEGGPRDTTPPKFVRANPLPGSTNVNRSRIEVIFNENIKVEDISNKLVISPAQAQNPAINANGHKLTVELRDTLIPNTTYTFDFSDAIRDLNEGNILDGFALDFSTGETIDTLRISGMVFEARNLEPAQGMVVGVYSNLSDSALRTLPLERVAKTNQYGEFTIRGLKPGTYNIFAIDDRNHDWHWDRSENIAFSSVTIAPSVEPVEIADTLRSSVGTDSIVTRTGYRYLPDDVLLTWFNENYRPQYLRDSQRNDSNRVTLKFGAPHDTMPDLTILTGPRAGQKLADLSVIETRAERDSLVYWFTDRELIRTDSLRVAARHLKTDSLDHLVWVTDTLKLFSKPAKPKKEKKKKDAEADTIHPPIPLLDFKAVTSPQQELHLPATFESATPIASIDSLGWKLEIKVDTLWSALPGARFERDSLLIRRYHLSMPWVEGAKYRFTVDSIAITDIYGVWNKPFTHEFTVKGAEEYGNIFFTFTDRNLVPDSIPLRVELLNQQDKPVADVMAQAGVAQFSYVAPGTYYARAYIDSNADGQWSTGSIADSIQPEDVFYYPKKLNLKKNWDINQEWALFDTPVELQKPDEIKKNKPKTKDGSSKRRNSDDDDDGESEEGIYDEQGGWGNGAQYNNSRRGNNMGGMRGGGGLQRASGHM